MIDGGAFGNDQSHTTFGPPAIIVTDLCIGDTPGRELAGHGRHNNSIGQLQFGMVEGFEQYIWAHGAILVW